MESGTYALARLRGGTVSLGYVIGWWCAPVAGWLVLPAIVVGGLFALILARHGRLA